MRVGAVPETVAGYQRGPLPSRVAWPEQRDLCEATRPMYAFNVRLYGKLMQRLRIIDAPPGSGHAQLIKYAYLARQVYSNALKKTEQAMQRSRGRLRRHDDAGDIQTSFNLEMEHVVIPQYAHWLEGAVNRAVAGGGVVPKGIWSDAEEYGVLDSQQD